MPSLTAVVDNVTAKETKTGKMMYTVEADGKKITTFELADAEAARALKGKKAVIEFVEKQNGDYLNRNLVKIEAAGGAAAPTGGFSDDPRQGSIERQVALKCAIEFCKSDEKANLDGIVVAAATFAAFLAGSDAPATGPAEPYMDGNDIPFAPTI